MKKFLAKICCLMLVICVAITTLVGCSESEWKGNVTLKNSGEVKENGGFIAETENYLYFINGVEISTANNEMGTPLKGALLVADKNDLSKTEVVVPKLMVASDYQAGVFIDGGYVYYATPSVEKNSEGQVARDELTFMRTKLDGSGKTDEYFTIDGSGAIGTQYRIVKGENGGVFIYYYDTENTAIVCYNTSTKKSSIVIKNSDTANGDSLSKHFFLYSEDISDVVGYYTTTVYTDTYNAEAAAKPNYSRQVALYNRIYAIKAGSTVGELLVDGENQVGNKLDDVKYSISLIKDGYMFFTTTNSGTTDTFAIKEQDARVSANWQDASKITKIVNTNYLSTSTLIVSLSEIYVMGDTKVYKTTFVQNDDLIKMPIMLKDKVNKLLFIKEGYMYFYDVEGNVAKFLLDQNGEIDGDKKIIYVSEDTASTSWYNVEVKTIAGKEYLFYCDNSTTGKSYVKYVDLAAAELSKDTNGDKEDDLFYLDTDSIKVLGKMTDADVASVFDAKVNLQAVNGPSKGIGANADDDVKFKEIIDQLKAEYEGLSASVKDKVPSTAKNTLNCIEKAYEVVEKYKALDGIVNVVTVQEAEEQGYRAIYEEIKAYMTEFKNSEFRDGVDAFIANDLKANYTKAVKLFEAE